MALGLAVAHANELLNIYRDTTVTGKTVYMQLHTGDPGEAGTANTSAVTDRHEVTWDAPENGQMTLSAVDGYEMTTTETITHVSLWDANTSGTFLRSAELTTPVPVINGSTLDFSVLTVSYAPIAA